MMDKNEFSGSKAAEILVSLLNSPQYQHHQKQISSAMVRYNQILKELVESNLSVRLKKHFLTLTLERFQEQFKNIDDEPKTFALNVLSQRYKIHMKSLE